MAAAAAAAAAAVGELIKNCFLKIFHAYKWVVKNNFF
jgi:hypothetical protein